MKSRRTIWPHSLAFMLLISCFSGCRPGKHIPSPAENFRPPNREPGVGGFGERILNPLSSPSPEPIPKLKNAQTVTLSIPYYLYPPEAYAEACNQGTQAFRAAFDSGKKTAAPEELEAQRKEIAKFLGSDNCGDCERQPLKFEYVGDLDKAREDFLKKFEATLAETRIGDKTIGSAINEIMAPLKQRNVHVEVKHGAAVGSNFWRTPDSGPAAHVALVTDLRAGELYASSSLEKLNLEDLPNRDKVDPLFLTLAEYVVKAPPKESKICYSVPYQWSIIGMAFDTRFSDQFQASWGILLEPSDTRLGQIKLVSEDRLLMKTALVYLEGKLSTARALLRVEIESYTARRTSPPEQLQTAYRELDAFLKTDQRGKMGSMAQLKGAIEKLLELSLQNVAVQARSVRKAQSSPQDNSLPQDSSSDSGDSLLATLLGQLKDHIRYVFGSLGQNESRGKDDIFAELDGEKSDDAKVLAAAKIAITESSRSSSNHLQPFTPEQTAALETYFKQGLLGFTAVQDANSRYALGLLVSYARYLPKLAAMQQTLEGELPVDKLSARSVRQLAEIGAGFNLLKRQAFWILQTNVQDSQLYVQLPILCLIDPNVGLIQTRGSSFGFLSEQGVAVQSRAGQISSATRPMRYVVPYDGATGSTYHLVVYKEQHRSGESREAAVRSPSEANQPKLSPTFTPMSRKQPFF